MAAPSDPNRKNWLALSSAGAFVILAGFLLPRMVTLPTLDKASNTTAATEPSADPPAATPSMHLPSVENLTSRLDLGGNSGNVMAGSLVVFVAIVGLMWMRRRRSLARAAAAKGVMQVCAAVPLPYHCCVFLVEIGDRQMITGIDASGIKTVIALPEPAPVHG